MKSEFYEAWDFLEITATILEAAERRAKGCCSG